MPNVTTETWDAAWTHMARAKRKRLTDNIFDEYPTLGFLRASGRVEVEDGGKEIQEDVMLGKNSLEWFDGYDVLNTDAVDGVTAAFYPWRFAAVPVTISFTERQKARKADQAGSLLETKTMQSMKTAQDGINAAIYAAQTGKAMLGFQDIYHATSVLGGIDPATDAAWAAHVDTNSTDVDSVSSSLVAGVNRVNSIVNNSSEGNDVPTRAFTTLARFSDFQNVFAGTGYARITSGDSISTAGGTRDGDKPKIGPVLLDYDRDVSSGRLYTINPKYLKLKIMRGMNFAKTPFKEPANQLAMVCFIVVGLQLTTNNRRRLAVATVLT